MYETYKTETHLGCCCGTVWCSSSKLGSKMNNMHERWHWPEISILQSLPFKQGQKFRQSPTNKTQNTIEKPALCLVYHIRTLQKSKCFITNLTNILIPNLHQCKTRFLPQIWCLNMRGHIKFVYEGLNHTIPNWIALKWAMQSQSKACIAKLSCVDQRDKRA
jgi:hypothetical protein